MRPYNISVGNHVGGIYISQSDSWISVKLQKLFHTFQWSISTENLFLHKNGTVAFSFQSHVLMYNEAHAICIFFSSPKAAL